MKRFVEWVLEHFFRLFPSRHEPELIQVGDPGRDSPVFCAANFTLTVKRLLKAIEGMDAWLLVADTGGINVWCSAASKQFNAHSVIDAVKLSGIEEKVDGRTVIMPQLAAPGVDPKAVKDAIGWKVKFGPVYAKALPRYIADNCRKTESMRKAVFGFKHRADMVVSMNFPIWLVIAIVTALFWRGDVAIVSLLFWATVLILVFGYSVLPGRNGWEKSLIYGVVLAIGVFVWGWSETGHILGRWGLSLASLLMSFSVGFDLAGIVAPAPSDAEAFLLRLGFKNIGPLMKEKNVGSVELDRERCIGCRACFNVCPVRVFGELDEERKMTTPFRERCFACGGCVMQCPGNCLKLVA